MTRNYWLNRQACIDLCNDLVKHGSVEDSPRYPRGYFLSAREYVLIGETRIVRFATRSSSKLGSTSPWSSGRKR